MKFPFFVMITLCLTSCGTTVDRSKPVPHAHIALGMSAEQVAALLGPGQELDNEALSRISNGTTVDRGLAYYHNFHLAHNILFTDGVVVMVVEEFFGIVYARKTLLGPGTPATSAPIPNR